MNTDSSILQVFLPQVTLLLTDRYIINIILNNQIIMCVEEAKYVAGEGVQRVLHLLQVTSPTPITEPTSEQL